ncbi:hypothetical protein [Haloarchaeobius sp. DFWS5]|jgi:ABC-type iron transport system FetAB permease component|uniref:hypothetical protein n=1 Tax=Haloarchaeobius sp. DFWS5 TaxID=3446114 RepID=UPI003EBB5E46
MSGSPPVSRTLPPLALLAFALAAIFSPTDLSSQLLWYGSGLVLAVVGAVWFARQGSDVLSATVADLWLFAMLAFAVVFLSLVMLPEPVLSPLEGVLVTGLVALVAGGISFAGPAKPIRRLLQGQQ